MKKVKVLMVAGRMHYGGLETMLMNFIRNIDSEKISFDFMLNYEEKGIFDNEIIARGGKIFVMPRLIPRNLLKYIFAVNKFFKSHKGEYDVVHGNLTSVGIIYLTIAKIYGVKTRIIHAHYAETKNNKFGKLEKLLLVPLRFCADYYFACSNKAGKFCFGKNIIKNKNYFRINNAIDTEKFTYNIETRNEIRKELHLENKLVLCHIGRFNKEKNHKFIIEIFNEIHHMQKQSMLVLVGDGEEKTQIQHMVNSYNLQNYVLFLGVRNDVNVLLQGADIFLLPSFYEGLPVVSIEAQSVGLPCFMSDNITDELNITGNCSFLSLQQTAKDWANCILKSQNFQRKNMSNTVKSANYDIKHQATWLENFYLKNS